MLTHKRIILDVHTHHSPPQPEGIVALDPEDLPAEGAFPVQYYSVGIHPWNIKGIALTSDQLSLLEERAARPDVVAIGETGIDTLHLPSSPMAGQINALRSHIEISERLGKPLIIHCVKGQDMIVGLRKEMQPRQPWIIHGFRAKPTVMKILTDVGCHISFGARFNPDSLRSIPAGLILAETDEDPGRIQDVIASLSSVREDVTPELIAANMRSIFKFP